MTKAEFIALRKSEFPKTLKLLRFYPEEKKDLKPSPIIRTAALDRLSEEDFQKQSDGFGTKMPLSAVLLSLLLDHIHHRGQFTIYSRLAGAKVPQIYGPSADEPWQPPK